MQVRRGPKYLSPDEIFDAHPIHAACASVRAWVLSGRNWALTTFIAVLSLANIAIIYVRTENFLPISID